MLQPLESKKLYKIHLVHRAPRESGIYCWYCVPSFDSELKKNILETDNISEKEKKLKQLFDNIFSKFTEMSYRVKIHGDLKPNYDGYLVNNKNTFSQDKAKELIKNILPTEKLGEKLNNIEKCIEDSVPVFSSPLYIGVAGNLQQRLKDHKNDLEHFKKNVDDSSNYTEEKNARRCFAMLAINNKIRTDELRFCILQINYRRDEDQFMEYLLNRLNYPLFGGN